MTTRQLLTVPQVAEQFQVTAQTIRNWIDGGALPAVRVGRAFRVRSEDVDALLERADAESSSLATRPRRLDSDNHEPAAEPRSGNTRVRVGGSRHGAPSQASLSRPAVYTRIRRTVWCNCVPRGGAVAERSGRDAFGVGEADGWRGVNVTIEGEGGGSGAGVAL